MTIRRLIPLAALVLLGWFGWGLYASARQAGLNKRLITAVDSLDATAVRQLLAEGADPNTRQGGDPPPTWRERLRAIFGLGHSPTPTRHRGRPIIDMPLWDAEEEPDKLRADTEIVRLLAARGADVNAIDDSGDFAEASDSARTPLTFALYTSDPTLVGIILEHKAEVGARDGDGTTPLMHAVETSSPSTVVPITRLLVAHGADVNARDNMGYSVLWHARNYELDWGEHHQETVRQVTTLLIQSGAKDQDGPQGKGEDASGTGYDAAAPPFLSSR